MPQFGQDGIGAPLQFASSGGGGGNYDDPDDDDYYEEPPEEPAPRRRRDVSEERQPTAGRQRTVQSDPDERYWTDYLRIALPVIGLLLVIAVFWFWAQQLIDDDAEDLTPTEQGLAEIVDVPTAVDEDAVASPTPEDTGQNVAPPPTEPQDQQQAMPSPTPILVEPETEPDPGTDNQVDEEPIVVEDPAGEEEPVVVDEPADAAAEGGIVPDAEVVVTEGPLNLRASSSTEADIVTVLETGAVLTVLSGPEESENFTWWQVVDTTTGNQGWVAEDFIELSE